MNAPVYGEQNEVIFEQKDFSDKVALIDADYFKYLTASAMYKKIMNEGLMHSRSMLNEVIDFYLGREVFNNYKAKAYVFCFSAPSKQVFRNHFAQEKKYKGNRENVVDNNAYPDKFQDMAYVYQYIKERYITLFYDDLEADDLVCFLQDPEKTFIASIDKDLKQVPGYHFDLKRRVLYYTSEEEGFDLLIKQCLSGDSTDGIPGLKGCGPKAIIKISENKSGYPLFMSAINEFVSKKGLLHGIDTFVEMWSLVSMKINRGDYFKEKYASAIKIVNGLITEE